MSQPSSPEARRSGAEESIAARDASTRAALASCVVVIATRNRPEALARCLEGLAAQTYRRFRIVIVDDASETPLEPIVAPFRASGLDISLHRMDRQSGPAAARNAGAAAAGGADYIVFIDDDVVADRHLVEVHLRAVARGADDSTPYVSFGPFVQPADWRPTPWNLWEARQAKKEADAMLRRDYEPGWRQFHTGNNCVSARAFRAVGGFDAAFKRAEDDELAIRLRDFGCTFVFEPSAIAWHYSNRSRDAWLVIPAAYARFDVEIDRKHPHMRYLAEKKWGLSRRRAPLRLLRRVFAGRRADVGVRWSVGFAETMFRFGLIELSMGALSVAYDLSYTNALAEVEERMMSKSGLVEC